MSRFKVQHLFDQGMVFDSNVEHFPSMAKAFNFLERSIETGGFIQSVYVRGDVMTLFAQVGDEQVAFQIVPIPESPL